MLALTLAPVVWLWVYMGMPAAHVGDSGEHGTPLGEVGPPLCAPYQ
ncbi:hypothetical protein GALL_504010 [mine drainage metagenome]|uniref:Uncharacterized protein n=1 Tax=mine drainage metagenome TaxID=410659 RepID=A0A1J5PWL8_9ZZZZ